MGEKEDVNHPMPTMVFDDITISESNSPDHILIQRTGTTEQLAFIHRDDLDTMILRLIDWAIKSVNKTAP